MNSTYTSARMPSAVTTVVRDSCRTPAAPHTLPACRTGLFGGPAHCRRQWRTNTAPPEPTAPHARRKHRPAAGGKTVHPVGHPVPTSRNSAAKPASACISSGSTKQRHTRAISTPPSTDSTLRAARAMCGAPSDGPAPAARPRTAPPAAGKVAPGHYKGGVQRIKKQPVGGAALFQQPSAGAQCPVSSGKMHHHPLAEPGEKPHRPGRIRTSGDGLQALRRQQHQPEPALLWRPDARTGQIPQNRRRVQHAEYRVAVFARQP